MAGPLRAFEQRLRPRWRSLDAPPWGGVNPPVLRPLCALLFASVWLTAAPVWAQAGYGGARVNKPQAKPDAGPPVLTKAPQLLQNVEPVYPEEAKAEKLTGDVVMTVDLDAAGKVAQVLVTQSAGHGFDEAAIAAVKQFVFSPAEFNGEPAPVRLSYTQHFVYVEPPPPPPVDAGFDADGGAIEAPAVLLPLSLKGRILERASRKAVPGAAVFSSSAPEPAVTEPDGSFELRMAPGQQLQIRVESANHVVYETKENVAEGEQLEVTYYLMPKRYGLYETVVKGAREKKEVTRRTLQREELEKVPGSMGDPVRVIQNLPGVARAPLLSGALIVRGASPNDTGSYFDGVEVPLLYHFLGGPSVVNSEFIDRIDFYPGGFGPKYGRAIGGVVDITTRSPSNEKISGSAKIDLIDSGVYLSAPIVEGLTVSVAARRSYLDTILPVVLPFFTDAAVLVAPRYYDYQARVDWRPQNAKRHKLRLFVFGSDDKLQVVASGVLPGGASFDVNNRITFIRASLQHTYTADDWSLESQPFAGRNGVSLGLGVLQIDSRDLVGGLRENLEVKLTRDMKLRMGLDIALQTTSVTARFPAIPFNYRPFPGESPDRPPQSLTVDIDEYDWGGYVEGELNLPGKLKIFPGARMDLFRLSGVSRGNVEPRLIIRKDFGQDIHSTGLKGSIGLYGQSPGAANLNRSFGNPNIQLQRAFQSSLGVEHKFTEYINLDVTAFFNRRFNLSLGGPTVNSNSNGNVSQTFQNDKGVGRAFGVEVMARHEVSKDFFGWIAYTLSWSQQKAPGQDYRYTTFDQRHILTLVAQYKFGNGFEAGGRFRLVTGTPTTPIDDITYDSDTLAFRSISGAPGSTRNPLFNQLDLRVDKTFLFDLWQLGLYVDVQNVYNFQNQEGVINDYRFRTKIVIPGIPILPTLGVKGSF